MVELNTTTAALIKPNWSDRVPSPAYDSLTPEQRRETRLANPWSFLNVTLSPEDLSVNRQDINPRQISHTELITLARESLDRILAASAFSETQPCFYLYQLKRDQHTQTALIAELSADSYASGQLKIHEQIKPERAELLAQHIKELGVISSPIATTYRNNTHITELIDNCLTGEAILTLPTLLNVEQSIWKISDPLLINRLKDAFDAHPLYIIDGHHRAAATFSANQKLDKNSAAIPLFCALFPHDQLQLLGFNRWIKPEIPLNIELLLKHPQCEVIDSFESPAPSIVTIYTNSTWLKLKLQPPRGKDPAESTDAALLQTEILSPVLGILNADDPAIINIPGNHPVEELCEAVDQSGGIAIFVAPIGIELFLEIANSNAVLPPKSTYFTPKVQSGIFLRSM